MIGGIGRAGAAGPLDASEQVSAAATPTTAPDFGPEHPVEKVLAKGLADLFANRGALKSKIEDYRSAADAARALEQPLAVPAGSKPFGPATVLRPGLPNGTPRPRSCSGSRSTPTRS